MGATEKIYQFWNNAKQKGFFHLLSANYLIGFLGFASQLLVVKFLTPEEMGQIKAFQSYSAVLVILAGFGLNTAVLKICSEKIDSFLKKQIFCKNFTWTLLLSTITILGVWLATSLRLFFTDENLNYWFRIYSFLLPATALTSLAMCYLQALKRIQLMAKTQSILRLIGIIAVITLTWKWQFPGFIWATLIVAYVCLVAIIYLIKDHFVRIANLRTGKTNWAYGAWSTAANFVGALSLNMDILILNQFGVDKEVLGYYSIATIFLMGLNFITQTVQTIATPYFSEKSDNRSDFVATLKKYQSLLIGIALVSSIIAAFALPVLIDFFYGARYSLVGSFFRILVCKYLFMSSYSLIGIAIFALGKMNVNFYMMLVNTLFSFFLSVLMYNYYDIWGVAYAQVISYLFNLVLIYSVGSMVIRRHFSGKSEDDFQKNN